MHKYECSYCGEPLCPELCPEAKAAHKQWVGSDEFKTLMQDTLVDKHHSSVLEVVNDTKK